MPGDEDDTEEARFPPSSTRPEIRLVAQPRQPARIRAIRSPYLSHAQPWRRGKRTGSSLNFSIPR